MKLCTDCNQTLPPEAFNKAHPDFPTRDGRQYCCRSCNEGKPKYRLVPGAGPFRKIERVEP